MGTSLSKSSKGTRRALLVGCNYPKTKAELAGCVNDVENWYRLLTEYFGFAEQDITVLVDEGDGEKPTGKNIKKALTSIVKASKPGDIVFFQFSGHGVQVPADEDGDYEEDGLDEALCPTDLNLIVDDDLREILSELDPKVKFTMVSDCCHSGGMLDHEEIQIQGGNEANAEHVANVKKRGISIEEVMEDMKPVEESVGRKNRAIDLETMAAILEEGNKEKVQIKKIRSSLYDVYGMDSSNAAISTRMRDIQEEMQDRKVLYGGPGKKPETTGLIDPNKGILITGCQSTETSADVTGADGRSFGALSHTIVRTVERHRRKFKNKPLSNYELVVKVRQLLHRAGFAQNPCLECSQKNANGNFIVW